MFNIISFSGCVDYLSLCYYLYLGSVAGQLIYHRTVWFSQKNVILFNGADSPVTVIAWRGNIVAWGDATQVRIMDLNSQSAICFLNCPVGVGLYSPLPCCLFWESECDLLIGWADSVRHVQLSSVGGNGSGLGGADNEVVTARSVVDWETDCIICGISSFDADHVVILGYAPPGESQLGLPIEDYLHDVSPQNMKKTDVHSTLGVKVTSTSISTSSIKTVSMKGNTAAQVETLKDSATGSGSGSESELGSVVTLNQPEIQIILRATGELVSSDLLALNNVGEERMSGPRSFQLLSTYNCHTHGRDAQKWRLSDVLRKCPRGGLRGLSPTLFIITPQDFIAVRVRDVNDYIKRALTEGDLKAAVDLALKDRLSLRAYRYPDLVALYIDDLLERDNCRDGPRPSSTPYMSSSSSSSGNHGSNNGQNKNNLRSRSNSAHKSNYLLALQPKLCVDYATLAALECQRLIGDDSVLWERWIYTFAKRRCLQNISPVIPVRNPRLPLTVYEVLHITDSFSYEIFVLRFRVFCRFL